MLKSPGLMPWLLSGTLALVAGTALSHAAEGARTSKASVGAPPGVATAQAISTITGVAISPLLGVGAVGAWQYIQARPEERSRLPWHTKPAFWIPALLLVGLVAAKDVFGTAAPTALKKPLDVAEAVENKVSGLVMAGAFVPLVAAIIPWTTGGGDGATTGLAAAGFAAFDPASVLNVLLVPFAILAYGLVWLMAHSINMLILISPFTTVDAALKGVRVLLLGLVTGTSFANPYLGAAFAVAVIVLAYFLGGWSLRLTVLGSVYIWDFLTLRRTRFTPDASANWMFTGVEIEKVPVRTYGKLRRGEHGALVFEFRPWLILKQQTLRLPPGRYAVGRALLLPELVRLEDNGNRLEKVFLLPPRYRTHEAELASACELTVTEIGVLRGLKAFGAGLRGLFAPSREPTAEVAAAG